MIDAYEGKDVAVANVSGAYLHAEFPPEKIHAHIEECWLQEETKIEQSEKIIAVGRMKIVSPTGIIGGKNRTYRSITIIAFTLPDEDLSFCGQILV